VSLEILNAEPTWLTQDTPLWRYVRLSTLLLMLKNRVYIPSLAELRRGDPTEASFSSPARFEKFKNSLSAEDVDWLTERAHLFEKCAIRGEYGMPDVVPDAPPDSEGLANMRASVLEAIWLRELGLSRCAWCWHAGDIESMAQWHVYARDGVAIRSSARRIAAAIEETQAVSHAQMRHLDYINFSDRGTDCDASIMMKPYFVKQSCYWHERDVRVVFCHIPTLHQGLMLELDWEQLIEEVVVSPLLHPAEEVAVADAIKTVAARPIRTRLSKAHVPSRTDDWSGMLPFTLLSTGAAPRLDLPPIMQADFL
jgi:hypothetical protein